MELYITQFLYIRTALEVVRLCILYYMSVRHGQGEKAEWRNSRIDITINLHIAIIVFTGHAVGFTCMEIYALQGHVHGNLCLARA